jgi:hypothetical protein
MTTMAVLPVPYGTLLLALVGLMTLVGLLLVAVAAALLLQWRLGEGTRRGVPSPTTPPAGPAAGAIWLRVRRGPGAGGWHPLSHPTTLLGSDPSAQVRLLHPAVAARHAALSWEERGIVLRDLGSQPGTLVNGHPIRGAVWVRPGDVIGLGRAVELELHTGTGRP